MASGRTAAGPRVLVAQSYFLEFDPKLKDAGQPAPPLGSLVCAAILRERGMEVSFFDSMLASSEKELIEEMDRSRPEVLVVFEDSFNYLTKMCLSRMREAAESVLLAARARGIDAVVAGSDASDDPAFYLKAGASAVALGEGEWTVAEWIERRAPTVRGLATFDEDGRLRRGEPRAVETDLSRFPPPAWDLIDIAAYRTAWVARHGRFSLPLATSRGCPFHCNWCAKPIWGQRYNAMSPGRAASEVARIAELGASHVNILDDIFGLRPDWLEAFADAFEARGLEVRLRCLSRADLLGDRTVAALRRVRCDMVWIGAESGSQRVLDWMEKGVTVEQIEAAARRLRGAGIAVGLFIQFGYPGESDADIARTHELIDRVLPDDIGISVSYPLPGTPFHARVRESMGGNAHWRDSDDLAMLFRGTRDTRFYRDLHAYTHARFRMNRALRDPSGDVVVRGGRVLRHGLARTWYATRLAFASRGGGRVPELPVALGRDQASRPSPQAADQSPLER